MDDLHRLYEHQTMMAIGIYSFLDNLLARIPNSVDAQAETAVDDDNAALSPLASLAHLEHTEDRSTISNVSDVLAGVDNLTEDFANERVGAQLLPDLATWTTNELAGQNVDEHPSEPAIFSGVGLFLSDPVDLTEKPINVEPGGYAEDIFIHLSKREKEEYMCSICYGVLKEAHQCQNEHKFCYGCIYTWSTGSSIGHDCCPVCRCDGLYAKNCDLDERIHCKRVRCRLDGCNWMGMLSEYLTHEHRKYGPFELDLLLNGSLKEPPEKNVQNDSIKTAEVNEELQLIKTPQFTELPDQTDNIARTLIGSLPPTTIPITILTDLQHRDNSQEIQTSLSLNRIHNAPGRSEGAHTTDNLLNRLETIEDYTSNAQSSLLRSRTPSPNATLRPPWNRHIPRTYSNASHITNQTDISRRPRQMIISSHRSSHGPAGNRVHRKRTLSRNSRNSRSPTLVPSQPSTSTGRCSANVIDELIEGIRSGESLNAPLANVDRVEQSDDRFSSINTESRSNTQRTGNLHDLLPSPTQLTGTSRSEVPTLPEIGERTALTTRANYRPVYESDDSTINSETAGYTLSESRPLHFRRLVPRRRGRVVEQLRETREQLSDMLRLMTMELEERRQHVLNAALETAVRTRTLRTLNAQLAARLEEVNSNDQVSRTNCRTVSDETDTSPPERGNNNTTRTRDLFQSLSTPERSRHCITYANLTRRLEPIFTAGQSTRPFQMSSLNTQPDLNQRIDVSSMTDNTENTSFNLENGIPFPPPNSRILARLRAGSLARRSPTPSVLLLTRQRNLGRLLSRLNYTSVQGGWSSDDEENE